MSSYLSLLNIATKKELNIEEIAYLLSPSTPEERSELHKLAYEVKKANVGTCVYLRGLIEFSNYCTCDCLYCGIRKSNTKISRFILSKEEILAGAKLAWEFGYGSIVLQSGELVKPKRKKYPLTLTANGKFKRPPPQPTTLAKK